MARSKYIYFVRKATLECELLGAFTVKHEANRWAFLNGWSPEHANLSRMRDGVHEDKTENRIPWTVLDTPENDAQRLGTVGRCVMLLAGLVLVGALGWCGIDRLLTPTELPAAVIPAAQEYEKDKPPGGYYKAPYPKGPTGRGF